jgi:glutathione S-transferase
VPDHSRPDAKLYVILGSHACRTGMLLLEHKGIPYKPVRIPTGLHPVATRLLGFPGNTTRDFDGGRKTLSLRLANLMGTVPALRMNGDRVQTNRGISRYLDRIQPDPPLFPADPSYRREVEEAEEWGDRELQMVARRLALSTAFDEPDAFRTRSGIGRLGPILFRNDTVRYHFVRGIGRTTFSATGDPDGEMAASARAMLDRVDAWIGSGVLNGPGLNAADYMVVTSLAVLEYRDDFREEIAARPSRALLDRVLPAPA